MKRTRAAVARKGAASSQKRQNEVDERVKQIIHKETLASDGKRQEEPVVQSNAAKETVGEAHTTLPPAPSGWILHMRWFARYQIVTRAWFRRSILLVIILNMITLAMSNPRYEDDSGFRKALKFIDEYIFLAIYIVEMACKMVALGFLRLTPRAPPEKDGKKTGDDDDGDRPIIGGLFPAEYQLPDGYFRSGWNTLDFVVIVIGVVSMTASGEGAALLGLRALRLLRPLRTINNVPELRVVTDSIINAIPSAVAIVVLLLFLYVVFGAAAMSLFSGELRSRCVTAASNYTSVLAGLEDRACSKGSAGFYKCPEGSRCGGDFGNPFYGTISFDNVFDSFYSLFWVSTLTTWDPVMYATMDAVGPASCAFFIIFIFIMTFFAINLFLAVITDKYADAAEKLSFDRAVQERERWAAQGGANSKTIGLLKEAGEVYLRRTIQRLSHQKNEEYVKQLEEDADDGTFEACKTKLPINEEFFRMRLQTADKHHAALADKLVKSAADLRAAAEELRRDLDKAAMAHRNRNTHRDNHHDVAHAQHVAYSNKRHSSRAGSILRGALSTMLQGKQQRSTRFSRGNAAQSATADSKSDDQGDDDGVDKMEKIVDLSITPARVPVGTVSRLQTTDTDALDSTRSVSSIIGQDTRSVALQVVEESGPDAQLDGKESLQDEKKVSLDPFETICKHAVHLDDEKKKYHKMIISQEAERQGVDSKIRSQLRSEWTAGVYGESGAVAVMQKAMLEVHERYLALHQHIKRHPWCLSVYRCVVSRAFILFITLAIISDIFVGAADHDGISSWAENAIYITRLITSCIFIVEAATKITGMGWRHYIDDSFNKLDFALALLSLVELCIPDSSQIITLRVLRVFRILDFFRHVEKLRMLLAAVYESLMQIVYISVIMGLFIFIFTVLGMSFFSGKLDRLGDTAPRQSFDTFYSSLLVIYQMLSGDSWPDMTWALVGATSRMAIVFSCGLSILGTYVIFNIFVAALLSQLSAQDNDHIAKKNMEIWLAEKESLAAIQGRTFLVDRSKIDDTTQRDDSVPLGGKEMKNLAPECEKRSDRRVSMGWELGALDLSHEPFAHMYDVMHQLSGQMYRVKTAQRKHEQSIMDAKNDAYRRLEHPEGVALGCFAPENKTRIVVFQIAESLWFDAVMAIAVVLNCLILVIDNPHDGKTEETFVVMNLCLNIIFTLEFVVKVIALGLYGPPKAYFKSTWNVIDFVCLISGWVDVQAFVSLRALRPLRILSKSEGMQVVLFLLYMAFPAILAVIFFCSVLFLITGVWGVGLFKGKFGYCLDASVAGGAPRSACPAGQWRNRENNFDDIQGALLTLFQVATLSDWNEVMYAGIDAVGKDRVPQKNVNQLAGLYFIVVVFCLGFFALNIFIGALIDAFSRTKDITSGKLFLTKKQANWQRAALVIRHTQLLEFRVDEPEQPLRKRCFEVVGNGYDVFHPFELFITVVLVLNTIVSLVQYHGQPEELGLLSYYANLSATVIFAVEAVAKISAWGWFKYWSWGWNRLDFGLVIISIALLPLQGGSSIATVFRIVRIARIFRFVKRFKTLQKLYDTLMLSVPSVKNVTFVIVALFFVFAIMGVHLFGKIKQTPTGLTDHANFEDFGHAMLVLWRVTTGDMWEYVMFGTMIDEDNSDCSKRDGNCGSEWSPVYFVSFVTLCGLIMINLFVAIVIENFSATMSDIGEKDKLEMLTSWKEQWAKFDRNNRGFMPVERFLAVMLKAPLPFGFGENDALLDETHRSEDAIERNIRGINVYAKWRITGMLGRLELMKVRIYRYKDVAPPAEVSRMTSARTLSKLSQRKWKPVNPFSRVGESFVPDIELADLNNGPKSRRELSMIGTKGPLQTWVVCYTDVINAVAQLAFDSKEAVFDPIEPSSAQDNEKQFTAYEWLAVRLIEFAEISRRTKQRNRRNQEQKGPEGVSGAGDTEAPTRLESVALAQAEPAQAMEIFSIGKEPGLETKRMMTQSVKVKLGSVDQEVAQDDGGVKHI